MYIAQLDYKTYAPPFSNGLAFIGCKSYDSLINQLAVRQKRVGLFAIFILNEPSSYVSPWAAASWHKHNINLSVIKKALKALPAVTTSNGSGQDLEYHNDTERSLWLEIRFLSDLIAQPLIRADIYIITN
ncbi:hypothetical protein B0H12DRAFT_848345 [Mycena haematopus]|nr:hypothetical protein B0H12DRAFT_848345 [Mycena haematopus]